MKLSGIAAAAALLPLAGCATTQLVSGTVNVAGTIENIEVAQAVDNFGRFEEQPGAMASMVALTGGTVQVVNTINPSVTFPLSHMFVRTASATPSAATTTAGGGSTISGTVTWQQNFLIAPVSDPALLHNIAAVYRAVVLCGRPEYDTDLEKNYIPPRVYNRDDKLVPEPYYLEKPNCVLCLRKETNPKSKNYGKDMAPPDLETDLVSTTEPNPFVFGACWLHIDKHDPNDVPLGSSHGHRFSVAPVDYPKFSQFLILLLQPTPAPNRFATKSVPVPKQTVVAAAVVGKKHHPGHPVIKVPPQPTSDYGVYFDLPRLAPGPAEGTTRPNAPNIPLGIQPNPQ